MVTFNLAETVLRVGLPCTKMNHTYYDDILIVLPLIPMTKSIVTTFRYSALSLRLLVRMKKYVVLTINADLAAANGNQGF